MEHTAGENSLPKRGRKVLSDGSEVERPPLYKKPKHRRSSLDTKSHPGALSDDGDIMQDKKCIYLIVNKDSDRPFALFLFFLISL